MHVDTISLARIDNTPVVAEDLSNRIIVLEVPERPFYPRNMQTVQRQRRRQPRDVRQNEGLLVCVDDEGTGANPRVRRQQMQRFGMSAQDTISRDLAA